MHHFFGSGGGGGFPFGGFQGHDEDDEQGGQVDNTRYYEIMQLTKDATQEQIKSKYKELAKKLHPDRKGGDAQKFKELNQANQTLSDPEKRRIYDKFGTKGPQSDGSDLLNMFFGGGRERPGQKKQLPKVKPTKKALDITLQNIYNGGVIKVKHERTRNCKTCNGKGGDNVKTCTACKGKGRVVQMYQMGPGMYQQVQKNCDTCQGQGQVIAQGSKCKGCLGKKYLPTEKELQVPIQKGTPNNYPITLAGEGNQIPDALAGDLIFITQEQPHATFVRKGADLFLKKTITLVEALVGFSFKIKHLDNIEYTIYTGKGEIVGDHDKKVVRGLGMPFFKDQMNHGNLIIEFKVQMPKRGELTKEQLQALAAILPGKVNERPKDNNYEMLQDFDKENVNSSEEGGQKKDQEEEEYEEGGTGCQAQ